MTDSFYLATYEGAAPALFSTPDLARAYCDDFAGAEARGRCWDWMPEDDGVQEQWWVHEDDDRPTYATGGVIQLMVVDAEAAIHIADLSLREQRQQQEAATREGQS